MIPVKICGITSRKDAEMVVNHGASAIGMIFYQKSPRYILPEKIKIAIEDKLEQEQIAISFDFKLDREKKEAERKKIESQGIYNFNKKVSESITPDILKFQGIRATEKIAESQNAKVIVIGAGEDGLPIILGGQ